MHCLCSAEGPSSTSSPPRKAGNLAETKCSGSSPTHGASLGHPSNGLRGVPSPSPLSKNGNEPRLGTPNKQREPIRTAMPGPSCFGFAEAAPDRMEVGLLIPGDNPAPAPKLAHLAAGVAAPMARAARSTRLCCTWAPRSAARREALRRSWATFRGPFYLSGLAPLRTRRSTLPCAPDPRLCAQLALVPGLGRRPQRIAGRSWNLAGKAALR